MNGASSVTSEAPASSSGGHGPRRSRRVDRWIKRAFGDFQSRHVLFGLFAVLLLSSVAVTTWLIVRNGIHGTHAILVEVASRIERDVREEMTRFLDAPDRINRHTSHAIRSGQVDPNALDSMHRLFWGSSREKDSMVSAIYFGSAGGSFVGLDSASDAWPPTQWRYTIASPSTAGTRIYLPTDELGQTFEPPQVSTSYDPRTRPWFIRAAASDGPVWTDIYPSFDSGVPTLTRALAVYDGSGVMVGVTGVDLFLDHVQSFLHELDLGENGEVFVVGNDGTLIASHAAGNPGDAHGGALVPIGETEQRFTRAAGEHLADQPGGYFAPDGGRRERVVLDGARGWLSLGAIGREQGLDWSIGVFVPEGDYLQPLDEQLWRVLPLALLTLVIVLAAFRVFVELVAKPLHQLRNGAARIAVGDFDVPIDTACGNEVGDLARAIDSMRRRLRASFDELFEEKLRAEVTLASINDGVLTLTSEGTVRYMNPVAERLTGVRLADARGLDVEAVLHAHDERTEEPLTRERILGPMLDSRAVGRPVVVTGAGGDTRLVHCRAAPIVGDEGERRGTVLDFSDLSEELRLKSELAHQASHDELTNLVNRREFERRLVRAVESARRGAGEHALCYLDLDQFKLVNDGVGHEAGDELLRQLARLLEEGVRGGDTIGRLGGDEFGVLLENCTLAQATRVVESIRERVERFRFRWDGRGHGTGLSAGLVAIGPDTPSTIAVMRDADSACYIAKRAGRNRLHVHRDDDEALDRLRGERSWLERIERAFEDDRFSLRAQRIESTDARDAGAHRHVEILLRLADDAGNALSPAEFLPAAERYGLGARIDRWVVARTLEWLASPMPDLSRPALCSINLSGQSLGDETTLPFVVETIERTGVCPATLCFEVTETATIANLSSALGLIGTLRELGCAFALDDFGSGLSSFAYLKTLPVDYLKIDGMFVRDMLNDPLDRAMVRSINEVGQTMGMRTVAEYVENDDVRRALRDIGVDYVQGYGVGRPEPLETLAFAPLALPPAAGASG